MIGGNVPTFISDVTNLSLFFFLSVAEDLLILLIFSKNQLLVLLFSSVMFFYSLFLKSLL